MSAPSKPSFSRVRLLISCLLIGHLMAIVLPPLSLQTRSPLGLSPSVSTVLAWFEPYSQFLYVDRGYAFFAPDPGPSHLVQAAVTSSNGDRKELMFPDLDEQWPRLLYHRHFMLTEYLETIYRPPGPPPQLVELDPEQAKFWSDSRRRYEHVRQSYIDHLRSVYPDNEVAIRRVEHQIPGILQFQENPIDLDDESLYRVMLDLPVVWEDPNRQPVESIPPPNLRPSNGTSPPAVLPPATNDGTRPGSTP
ncbi:MAG: hypothetical protein AAGG48_08380 [Planctomycetota bacterium]